MNFGFGRLLHRFEVVPVDRRRNADQRADPIVCRSGRQRNIRPEGKAGGPQLVARVLRGHEVDCRPEVVELAAPLVPLAGAAANAAKVEAEYRTSDSRQRLRRPGTRPSCASCRPSSAADARRRPPPVGRQRASRSALPARRPVRRFPEWRQPMLLRGTT